MQLVPDLRTGGAERTTVDVAEAIVKRGWRSLVLSEGGRLLDELKATGSDHIEFPAGTKNPWKMWRNSYAIAKICREYNVSLIHGRSRAPAWSGLWAARRLNLPFITTYHGIYKQGNRFKAFYNSVMTRADGVIANSRYTADLIAERDPAAKQRITVIYRGSDLEALAPENVSEERRSALRAAWGLTGKERVVLNLARLTAWKGHAVLIDAFRALARDSAMQDVVVILAGDHQGRDEYKETLEHHIANAGLEGRVRLVGHCADVGAALAISDVSVVASIEPEAFGRAAVEAQAAGVPVIVSDIGAVPETVLVPPVVSENERTGWHFPNRDVSALASRLEEALCMPQEARVSMAERARSHVAYKFSKQAMCDATLDFYEQHLKTS
ncbi:glycosyltransferase family 4 protein [Pseudovibrio exalbescens]|uniref:glycosyltransferase family 4 protein n=1 Tax=Pseudovibrio exalbescens TaxID=197461 RepID=UPI0023659262|nr:glycosyltransferase family 4 protein [Pseudovibrio exalbescens]MDD7910029.1 glycosyltransferase family 4 protein [Pseudovibrio exalbescens]